MTVNKTSGTAQYLQSNLVRGGLCLGILAIACLGAFSLGTLFNGAIPVNEGLTIPISFLNFGEVWQTENFAWKFPMKNESSKKVEIEAFATSCSCASITPKSLALDPGEETLITLVIDLTPKGYDEPDLPVRDFKAQIYPKLSQGLGHLEGWVFQGRTKPPVISSPRHFNFGDTMVFGQAVLSKKIAVKSLFSLHQLIAKCDFRYAQVDVKRISDRDYEVNLSLSKELRLGSFSFAIVLEATDRENTVYSAIEFPVNGTVVQEIQAMPQSVLLGDKSTKENAGSIITLSSLLGKPFEIEETRVSSNDVVVRPLKSEVIGAKVFQVTQSISKVGLVRSSVFFSARNHLGDASLIEVPISYYGRSPD